MAKSEYKLSLTNGDWIDILRGESGSVSSSAGIYRTVPLIYRALRLRCNALASVPVHIYKGSATEPLEAWPFVTQPYDLIWEMQASLLVAGRVYVIPAKGLLSGSPRDFQVLNPFCVTEVYTADGMTFHYLPNTGAGQVFAEDEIIWLWEYNPSDKTRPGPGSAQVALNDARLLYYLSRFPGVFFERGGMPITLVAIKTMIDSEVRKVEAWFKEKISGIGNAFGIAAFKADTVSISTLTPPFRDMAFPALSDQARQAIADAFELPVTMISDASNYATAAQHDQSFWETSIKPSGLRIQQTLNMFLKQSGYRIELAFDELTAFQTDEAERAGNLQQLTSAGIPLVMAMRILGYDLDEEQWIELETINAPKEEPKPAQDESMPPQTDLAETLPPMEEMRAALSAYRRKCLHAVKRSDNPGDVVFTSSVIPEKILKALHYELDGLTDEDGVKAAFEAVQEPEQNNNQLVDQLKRANDLLSQVLNA